MARRIGEGVVMFVRNSKKKVLRRQESAWSLVARVFALGLVCMPLQLGFVSSVLAQSQPFTDNDLLLLDVRLDRLILGQGVTAYQSADGPVWVSLAEFANALSFPISVDGEAGTADGWFIAQDRTFSLNVRDGRVVIEGRAAPVSASEAMLFEGQVVVTTAALARWFPVDLAVSTTDQVLSLSAREQLPVQAQQLRRRNATQDFSVGPATLPRIETPYEFIGTPVVDAAVNYSIRRRTDGGAPATGLGYSAVVSGDLAYMDAQFYAGGDRYDPWAFSRLKLSRQGLNLPLGLRLIELGDIVPVGGTGSVERGFLIQGGGSLTERDDLLAGDAFTIAGDGLTGWDVELLQNGLRVGFQTIGQDGRYNFQNLEPSPGENVFELVFYGPSGERRREVIRRFSGLIPDQPGSIRYQLSATQAGRTLFDGRSGVANPLNETGLRVSAAVDYRLLSQLALRAGWLRVTEDGVLLEQSSFGLTTGWRDLTASLGVTRSDRDGTDFTGSLQLPASLSAALLGFDLRFAHTQFLQAVRENNIDDTRILARTQLTATRRFDQTSLRLQVFRNQETDRIAAGWLVGAAHSFDGGLTVGNNLVGTRFYNDPSAEPDRLTGNLYFSANANPLFIRGGVDYEIDPESRVRQYSLDGSLHIASDMTFNFGVNRTIGRSGQSALTRYSSGLSWFLPWVTISPRLTYDSDGRYAGFVYASFSMAPPADGMTPVLTRRNLGGSGTVAARVFLDLDQDGEFGAADEPLPDVVVRAAQAGSRATTDQLGVALLTGLSGARATDVVVDEASLPEVGLAVVHAGNSVLPRPANFTTIDFPVVPTGDIEGRVVQQTGLVVSGVRIEARNAAGLAVASAISDRDGLFSLTVPVGAYEITIADERVSRLIAPLQISVNRGDGFVRAGDLVLRPADAAAGGPALPVAEVNVIAGGAPQLRPTGNSLEPERQSAASRPLPLSSPAPTQAAPSLSTREPIRADSEGRIAQFGAFSDPIAAQALLIRLRNHARLSDVDLRVLEPSAADARALHRVIGVPAGGQLARAVCDAAKVEGLACFAARPPA